MSLMDMCVSLYTEGSVSPKIASDGGIAKPQKGARNGGHNAQPVANKPACVVPSCKKPRVFDVGLPRTGTDSFCEFGERMGYTSTHVLHTEHAALHSCVTNASACPDLFPTMDPSSPDMFCDVPMTAIGCQLASAFQDASFVLITRPFEACYPST